MIILNRLWFGQIIHAKNSHYLDSICQKFDHIVLLIAIVDNYQCNKYNLKKKNNWSEMDHFGV